MVELMYSMNYSGFYSFQGTEVKQTANSDPGLAVGMFIAEMHWLGLIRLGQTRLGWVSSGLVRLG